MKTEGRVAARRGDRETLEYRARNEEVRSASNGATGPGLRRFAQDSEYAAIESSRARTLARGIQDRTQWVSPRFFATRARE